MVTQLPAGLTVVVMLSFLLSPINPTIQTRSTIFKSRVSGVLSRNPTHFSQMLLDRRHKRTLIITALTTTFFKNDLL